MEQFDSLSSVGLPNLTAVPMFDSLRIAFGVVHESSPSSLNLRFVDWDLLVEERFLFVNRDVKGPDTFHSFHVPADGVMGRENSRDLFASGYLLHHRSKTDHHVWESFASVSSVAYFGFDHLKRQAIRSE